MWGREVEPRWRQFSLEDEFLKLHFSTSDTKQELHNALKNSKHNINESSDSDTLDMISLYPRKRKRKNKIVLKSNKKVRKIYLLWFNTRNEKEMMQDLLQNCTKPGHPIFHSGIDEIYEHHNRHLSKKKIHKISIKNLLILNFEKSE